MRPTSGDDGHSCFDGMAVEHVLGGLSEEEGRLFRAHLLECGSCRAHVGELRAIAHELADVERDEARARAVQRLETKQHDEDRTPAQPASTASTGPVRSTHFVIIALLGVIILLSVWVFFLRGQVADLEGRLEVTRDIVARPDAIEGWELDTAEGVEGQLRENGDALVVMADALPEAPIELTAYSTEDAVLVAELAEVEDGHFLGLLRDLDAPLGRVTLTAPSLPEAEATLLEARRTD